MTGCLRNDGASLDGLQAAGLRILSSVDTAARVLKIDLRITCGTEGHPHDDPHTRGVALDIGVRELQPPQVLDLLDSLGALLPRTEFTMLLETPVAFHDPRLSGVQFLNPHATGPHIHCQLRKGLSTWPILPPSAPLSPPSSETV